MSESQAECVLSRESTLGEGPCWDEKQNRLLWVDIEQSLICIFDPASGENREIPTNVHCGFVVPTTQGDLVAGLQNGFVRVDPESGTITPISDPESELPRNRFNDGKCDPQGRLWAGTISYDREQGAASLYRMDADMSVHNMVQDVTTSNGLAYSGDGKIMYYIDTPTRRVDAFDFDPESGNIANRRTVVSIPEDMGKPDGMTIDAEGMLWVALWGGFGVTRWNPSSGELLHRVHVPARQTTSCAFGGENFDQLYITSARSGLDDAALSEHPQAGSLFKVQTSVQGLPCDRFAG